MRGSWRKKADIKMNKKMAFNMLSDLTGLATAPPLIMIGLKVLQIKIV
jgi:hypothetical protein